MRVLTLFNRATRQFHGLPQEPVAADRWAEHYQLFDQRGAGPGQPVRIGIAAASGPRAQQQPGGYANVVEQAAKPF